MPRPPRLAGAPQKVRIIGGRWKRWQLPVPDRPGLRPTPDRVRETLFNWLAEHLHGARCLDLFSGTGVLGLEALSRGAASAWLVERDAAAARNLREQLQRLQCTDAEVIASDVLAWLRQAPPAAPFHAVFIDPPYHQGLLAPCLAALAVPGWLAPGALAYLEYGHDEPAPALPAGWQVIRETRAGQVQACLCRTA